MRFSDELTCHCQLCTGVVAMRVISRGECSTPNCLGWKQ